MMRMINMAIALVTLLTACGGTHSVANQHDADTTAVSNSITFNGDSAYQLVAKQCDFGPRVPGSKAHNQCAEWLKQELTQRCDTMMVQQATVDAANGQKVAIQNLIGVINPQAEQRLLLLAHWDTRPWADNDSDPTKRQQPVMGANDGASGVGVLLEVARAVKHSDINLGIDIVLVDAEDMGTQDDEDSWALGAQYWASHPHVEGYSPLFGILLDMVGASDAVFPREYYSTTYAGGFVDAVWRVAAGNQFSQAQGGAVTDDHVFVNRAGIPCIDIIDLRDTSTGFFDAWHTTHDTIDCINRGTLTAVGQTVLNVIIDLER